MKSQKVFVCECIVDVLNENGIDYVLNGSVSVSDVLTPTMKEEVRNRTIEGFLNYEIQMTPQSQDKYLGDMSELKKYVHGLVNNWIRKNPEFNSGEKYTAKNPGSRQGSGDEQVREMRKLLKVTTDPESRKLIESAIQQRLEEIKPQVEIDVNKLPEHLRNLL